MNLEAPLHGRRVANGWRAGAAVVSAVALLAVCAWPTTAREATVAPATAPSARSTAPAGTLTQSAARKPPSGATAAVALPTEPPATLGAIPKPAAPSQEETAFVKLLDQAIAPIRNFVISTEDATRVRDAIAALGAANPAKAQDLRAAITDPVGAKLVDWYRLRVGYGEAAEYRAFLDKNPSWPDRHLLSQRLDEALFTQGGSAASIKSHFTGAPPKTGVGMAALASAYLAEGNTAEAKALAAKAWRELPIPATLETGFLERFGALLTESDHKRRLDRLLIDDLRWSADRSERAAFIRRLIPRLSPAEQKKAEARLAVFIRHKSAASMMNALPAEATTDWGLVFQRIQLLRRANRDDEAAKLLLSAPTDPEKIVSPDDWWEERRLNAYEALDAGKPKLAYDFVHDAGPLTVNPLKEQTFLAGWLALRFLKDAKAAHTHFSAMQKAADGPLSRAKAAYWLGRTAEARKDTDQATAHYRTAAKESDTFHGQLARQKLEPGRRPIAAGPPQAPSAAEIDAFTSSDAVKAVVVARKSGLNASITRAFLTHLRSVFETESGTAMVAHLAEAVGDTQTALRIGKLAVARGQNLLTYAYPVHPFPSYTPLRTPPETAFLLGIARQESEFNVATVSGAGARGLLQVMPVTAAHICRDYKFKCDIPRLLSDHSYNAMIASAYIGDRMAEFQGSYVLTLAGYNAGPGRARQWIAKFGDPRDPKVDVVDWIERIPFQETREYVAKVLSNIQIYRARLGEAGNALRLDEDLTRARLAAR